MDPSLEVRLRNIRETVSTLVREAVDKENAFAHEQVDMVAGHLHVISQQYRYQTEFDHLDFIRLQRLARHIISFTSSLPDAAEELTELEACRVRTGRSPLSEQGVDGRELTTSICAVLRALEGQQSAQAREVFKVVARSEYEQSFRYRSMFAPMGHEGADLRVLPIAEMMQEFRTEMEPKK